MDLFSKIKVLFNNTGLTSFVYGILAIFFFISGNAFATGICTGVFLCRNWDLISRWIGSKVNLPSSTE